MRGPTHLRGDAVDSDALRSGFLGGGAREADDGVLARNVSIIQSSSFPSWTETETETGQLTLLVEYEAMLGYPCNPATLDAVTMLASLSIRCSSARMQWNLPFTFTFMVKSQSLSVVSTIWLPLEMTPARLTAPVCFRDSESVLPIEEGRSSLAICRRANSHKDVPLDLWYSAKGEYETKRYAPRGLAL